MTTGNHVLNGPFWQDNNTCYIHSRKFHQNFWLGCDVVRALCKHTRPISIWNVMDRPSNKHVRVTANKFIQHSRNHETIISSILKNKGYRKLLQPPLPFLLAFLPSQASNYLSKPSLRKLKTTKKTRAVKSLSTPCSKEQKLTVPGFRTVPTAVDTTTGSPDLRKCHAIDCRGFLALKLGVAQPTEQKIAGSCGGW